MLVSLVAFSVLSAQNTRYIDEVFMDSEIMVTSDIPYGVNIDFLTSNLGSPSFPGDIVTLQTAVLSGQPIPAEVR